MWGKKQDVDWANCSIYHFVVLKKYFILFESSFTSILILLILPFNLLEASFFPLLQVISVVLIVIIIVNIQRVHVHYNVSQHYLGSSRGEILGRKSVYLVPWDLKTCHCDCMSSLMVQLESTDWVTQQKLGDF